MQTSRKRQKLNYKWHPAKTEDFRKQVRRVKLAEGIAGAIVDLAFLPTALDWTDFRNTGTGTMFPIISRYGWIGFISSTETAPMVLATA